MYVLPNQEAAVTRQLHGAMRWRCSRSAVSRSRARTDRDPRLDPCRPVVIDRGLLGIPHRTAGDGAVAGSRPALLDGFSRVGDGTAVGEETAQDAFQGVGHASTVRQWGTGVKRAFIWP